MVYYGLDDRRGNHRQRTVRCSQRDPRTGKTGRNGTEQVGGGDPAAIVSANLTAEETFFGVGEASLIVKDGQIYLYYTYNDQAIDVYDIHLATADASDPNWPAALSDKGKVIDRNKFAANSVSGCDVKYVDELNCFQAIHGVNVNEVNTYLAIWQSTDGITGWEQIGIVTDNTRVRLEISAGRRQ